VGDCVEVGAFIGPPLGTFWVWVVSWFECFLSYGLDKVVEVVEEGVEVAIGWWGWLGGLVAFKGQLPFFFEFRVSVVTSQGGGQEYMEAGNGIEC
jgi:hypothetical protein